MAVVCILEVLPNDVGMVLEDGDDLFGCWYAFTFDDAAASLIQNTLK